MFASSLTSPHLSSPTEPMRAPKGLAFSEIQSRQLTLQWEPLGYNLTRCHTYTVSLCYRYFVGSGHNQTFQECVKMERNANRYTIKNLLPYKNIHVKLILSNPEGRKEGKEVIFQTDEDGESARGGASSPKLESVAGELLGCCLWCVCIPGLLAHEHDGNIS